MDWIDGFIASQRAKESARSWRSEQISPPWSVRLNIWFRSIPVLPARIFCSSKTLGYPFVGLLVQAQYSLLIARNRGKDAYGVSIVTPPWRLKTSVAALNTLSRMMISVPAQSLVPSGTFRLIFPFPFGGILVDLPMQDYTKGLLEMLLMFECLRSAVLKDLE